MRFTSAAIPSKRMQAKSVPLRCSKPKQCAHEKKMAALGYYWNPKAALVAVGSRNCYSSVFFFPSASPKTTPHPYCCDDGKKITLKTHVLDCLTKVY